jgi:hypothetical protein
MKKYEVIVDDAKAAELTELLKNLPYVRLFRESDSIDSYTLASEESLREDWMLEEDDELQKLYGK